MFGGCLEQGTHIHVESTVGIAGSYHLCATVVTVLTHLCHHDTGATSFLLGELLGQCACLLEVRIVLALASVHS